MGVNAMEKSGEINPGCGLPESPRIALGDSKFVEYDILTYSVDHRTGMPTKMKQKGHSNVSYIYT